MTADAIATVIVLQSLEGRSYRRVESWLATEISTRTIAVETSVDHMFHSAVLTP